MKFRKKLPFVLPGLFFLGFIGYRILPWLRGLEVNDILNFTPSSPVLAAGVLMSLYCLKAFTLVIPLLALYLAAAVMFPVGWALVITYLCLAAEMSISYFIGRRFGPKVIEERLKKYKSAQRILEFNRDKENDLVSSLMVRLIPGLPVDLGSMFLGATRVRYWPYILGTLVGVSRGAVPIILMGSAVNNPLSPAFLVPFSLTAAMYLGVFVYLRKMKKASRARD
ncbi:MAG: VTT domain-containing protein [Peptococcia bacterium]